MVVVKFDNESYTIEAGTTISEPETPVRERFEFLGWYNDDTKFDFSTKITTNLVDGLDSLEKKLSAARDAAALENARAEKRRAALGQLDGGLTALEQSLAALGGAEAENVSLEARAEQLARLFINRGV